jgi:hypothetical protein
MANNTYSGSNVKISDLTIEDIQKIQEELQRERQAERNDQNQRRQQVRTGRRMNREQFDSARWRQLREEIDRQRREGRREDLDIIEAMEATLGATGARLGTEGIKNMSYGPDYSERVLELEKVVLLLLEHLGLVLELEEKNERCGDNHCGRQDCKHEKIWHIKPKPKDYKKDITKMDDLIITGEDEE